MACFIGIQLLGSPASIAQTTDEERGARLLQLLHEYHAELRIAQETQPSPQEIARREAAQREADKLRSTPFQADEVLLTGAQGSTALAQITQRLSDPTLAESRRDTAPIFSVRTRLFGELIASENHSLRPVGKNHYVAQLHLQPGDTDISFKTYGWKVHRPQDANSTDFLLTLYLPAKENPEFHIFSINELLSEENPHIPDWLPDELSLESRTL